MDDMDVTNQMIGVCLGFMGTGLLFGFLYSLARSTWSRRTSRGD